MSDLEKRLIQAVDRIKGLKEHITDLEENLTRYQHGFQGACYACEPVAELNVALEARIKELEMLLRAALPYLERDHHYAEVRYDREDDYGSYEDMKDVADLVCKVKSVLADDASEAGE